MRSIYSNEGVNLEYPYFISEETPLKLQIHTEADGYLISADKGYIYLVNNSGFRNEPVGSWQFIRECSDVGFHAIIETDKKDFAYPVEVVHDFLLQ